MAHWYAAIVKRSRERGFAEYLESSGFEAYIPREEKRFIVRRHPRQFEMREVPIIRGLVFIGAAANLARDPYAWHTVAQIPYYKALIGMNGEPRTIPQAEIDRMMAARKDKADLHVGYRSRVAVGEPARLMAGAFSGTRVMKVRELTGRRARVLALLLGAEREITVDDMDLEPWEVAAE